MPIPNLAAYREKVRAPNQRVIISKPLSFGGSSGRLFSSWTQTDNAGSIPTNEAPTRSTVGAAGQQNSANTQRVVQAYYNFITQSADRAGTFWVCDRLSTTGGLSGTSTSEQTTNLPTAALTRYTNGEGVLVALEIYAAVGTTASEVSIKYTNQSGVGNRISPLTTFGTVNFNTLRRFILLPLQEGDYGVRSVESVTLNASTGTVGNFGVTLFKPIIHLPVPLNLGSHYDPVLTGELQLENIATDACLWMIGITSSNAINGSIELHIAED